MARTPRAQKFFALAVALSVVLAFVPASWLRWTSDIAEVVSFPLRPFTHIGREAATRLRPAEPSTISEAEQRLIEDRDRFERLYKAAQARIEELEDHLEQLQRIPVERRANINWIIANITSADPRAAGGSVEINRGSGHGIEAGAIAVYGGVHLVGRVVGGVSRLHSRVEPISGINLIGARIFPRDAPEVRPADAPLAQLKTHTGGNFIVENIARDQGVRPGDVIRLDDRDWPQSAQMMVIGEVESVEPNDRDALRSIIIVRPFFRLRNLRTVLIESRLLAANEGVAP